MLFCICGYEFLAVLVGMVCLHVQRGKNADHLLGVDWAAPSTHVSTIQCRTREAGYFRLCGVSRARCPMLVDSMQVKDCLARKPALTDRYDLGGIPGVAWTIRQVWTVSLVGNVKT